MNELLDRMDIHFVTSIAKKGRKITSKRTEKKRLKLSLLVPLNIEIADMMRLLPHEMLSQSILVFLLGITYRYHYRCNNLSEKPI